MLASSRAKAEQGFSHSAAAPAALPRPRLRALALFRRPQLVIVDGFVMPASEEPTQVQPLPPTPRRRRCCQNATWSFAPSESASIAQLHDARSGASHITYRIDEVAPMTLEREL